MREGGITGIKRVWYERGGGMRGYGMTWGVYQKGCREEK